MRIRRPLKLGEDAYRVNDNGCEHSCSDRTCILGIGVFGRANHAVVFTLDASIIVSFVLWVWKEDCKGDGAGRI